MIIILEGKELEVVISEVIAREFPGRSIKLDDEGGPLIFVNHAQYDLPRIEVHLVKNEDKSSPYDSQDSYLDNDDVPF